jgi:serine/threonine protein kinase
VLSQQWTTALAAVLKVRLAARFGISGYLFPKCLSMLPKSGDVLADKYLLSDTLGAGGFGVVFKATDQLLGRTVAIKIMRVTGGTHEDGLKRFFGEARNTSQLSHPHNVRVFDFGHAGDEMVYLVMEHVDGQQLSSMPMPMHGPRLVKLLLQICRALGEAHDLGLVHRDLKPDNVLVSQVDGADFARVLDYGIAKLEGATSGLTATGGFIGTPQYAAPEQLTGKPIDRRADIYALGAMAWTLLVGRPLFVAEDPIGIAYMHVHQEPERPSAHVAISPEFDAALMTCLEKIAEHRYDSMDALYRALLSTPEASADAAPIGTQTTHHSLPTQSPEARAAKPLVPSATELRRATTRESATALVSEDEWSPPNRRPVLLVAGVLAALLIGVVLWVALGRGAERDSATMSAEAEQPTEAQATAEAGESATEAAEASAQSVAAEAADPALEVSPDDGSGDAVFGGDGSGDDGSGDTEAAAAIVPDAPTSTPERAAEPEPSRAAVERRTPRREPARTSQTSLERAAPAAVEPEPLPAAADPQSAEPEPVPNAPAEGDGRDRRSELENLLGEPEPEPEAEPEPPSRRDRLEGTLNRTP